MLAALQTGYGAVRDNIRLFEVAAPEPRRDEVLVRVTETTLNRKDLFALQNLTGPGIRPRAPLPHVNGADVWGVIAAVGPDARAWAEGDRVVAYPGLYCGACAYCGRGEQTACPDFGVIGEQTWGSHAQYVRVPARNLERVPDDLHPDRLVCASATWLTAWRALVPVANLRAGETLLIVGASGGVGSAAVAIGKLSGARVIAVVGGAWKAARALEIGADAAIDYGADDFAAHTRELTRGAGADVVLDSVGASTWRRSINALAPFGRMVICGATSGDTPSISIREIYQHHRRILGAPLGNRSDFRSLLAAVFAGQLSGVVHARLPLSRIHDALRLLEAREFFGKIVLTIDSGS
jgi:NADPH2:quinone reductase